MPTEVRPRSEVPLEFTWDVAAIFGSDAQWEDEFAAVSDEAAGLARFRGHLSDGPATLADYFEAAEHALRRLGRVLIYASNQHEVDTTDQVAAAMNDRSVGLYARAMATISFAEPEILALGFPALRRWLAQEPRLAIYAHYVDALERKQEHVRSAEVERFRARYDDLGDLLCPGGDFRSEVDGVEVRPDGLHHAPEATGVTWGWLEPRLRQLAGTAVPAADVRVP